MASKEIVTQDGSIASTDVVRWFQDPFEIAQIQEDPDEVARRIDEQLFGAATADDLFSPPEVLHGHEYLGKPFQLVSVEWRPAGEAFQDGLPFYGIFHILDWEGTHHVMTCGADSVVKKAAIASSRGWLPVWLKIVKAEKPTKNDRYPLDLVAAPEPVIDSEGKAF